MRKTMRLSVFLVLSLFLGSAEGAGRWSRTGNMGGRRQGNMGALLTDGRLLLISAMEGAAGNDYEGYDIFDPATGTWVRKALPAGSYDAYAHRMAMLLPNGEVLSLPETGVSWLYDPFASAWTASTSGALGWIAQTCATLLKNGDVLLMYNGQQCKLYDYAMDALSPTGTANTDHSEGGIEVLLPDGKVLVTGGDYARRRACEIYDRAAGTWTNADSLNTGRRVAVLLRSGQVLAAGAKSSSNFTSELYDQALDQWNYTAGNTTYAYAGAVTLNLLPSGEVLITGGTNCELFDPGTELWTLADNPVYKHTHFTSAILQTGKMLAAGGIYQFSRAHDRCEIYDPSDGVWTPKPSLYIDRAAHTVTPLPIIPTRNCSTNVLIAGGENPSGALKKCELCNYCLEHVIVTGDLNAARTHHTAVLLASGEVLAAGGKDGGALASSELFDVAGETWSYTTGAMSDARFDHTATLLKDGKVLVTGGKSSPGTCLNTCEVYSGGSWTTTGAMATQRTRHSVVLLPNGNILVIGGQTTGGAATNLCEIWNGTSWSGTGSLITGRYLHTTTLLQSGKVLVVGGTSDGSTPLQSCEIYDPVGNSWSAEADLNTARYLHNTTLLYSGLVLTTGGYDGSYLSSCEIWDPAAEWDSTTNTHGWKVTTPLATARGYHSSVLIPDTMPFVLVIGGNNGVHLYSIEEYDVGLGYQSDWQSTITNYKAVTHISPSMPIEGTLFRGLSEADGGNHCHITSNDHPIISLVRIGGGNWQGNGGGEILDVPLSSSWDEGHTTVVPAIADFQGYYRLWSIVNGIPSKWCGACPLGTEEKEQSTVHGPQSIVFPNPSTAGAGVHFRLGLSTMNRRPSTLTICDLTGRSVRSVRIRDSRFTIQGLKAGIYFYRVECQGLELKGKFAIVE